MKKRPISLVLRDAIWEVLHIHRRILIAPRKRPLKSLSSIIKGGISTCLWEESFTLKGKWEQERVEIKLKGRKGSELQITLYRYFPISYIRFEPTFEGKFLTLTKHERQAPIVYDTYKGAAHIRDYSPYYARYFPITVLQKS